MRILGQYAHSQRWCYANRICLIASKLARAHHIQVTALGNVLTRAGLRPRDEYILSV